MNQVEDTTTMNVGTHTVINGRNSEAYAGLAKKPENKIVISIDRNEVWWV